MRLPAVAVLVAAARTAAAATTVATARTAAAATVIADRWLVRPSTIAVTAVAIVACTAPPSSPAREPGPAAAVRAPQPARAAWVLTWHGAAIGGAWERDDGARFERRERIVVRRGEEVVISDLVITIDRDEAGRPLSIDVSRWQDGPVLAGVARATATGGWLAEVEGEAAVTLPAAVPFELAIRDAPRTGGFEGRVILAGWGFAVADLTLRPSGDRFLATLTVGARSLTATVRYDADGAVAEFEGGDGLIARRAAVDADLRPPQPAEVVDGNAIVVDNAATRADHAATRADHATTRADHAATRADHAASIVIRLPDATAPPPPHLPGQRHGPDGWEVALDASEPGALPAAPAHDDRTTEIAALVHRVAAEIDDDLGATAATAAAARTATRGDCTTHALRFAALAADAGIATQVVTGLRLDGASLIRHRWNLAWTGTRWIAVDATWDEAPAAPALIGLAVHGARAADLAAADATVFDGLGRRAIAR